MSLAVFSRSVWARDPFRRVARMASLEGEAMFSNRPTAPSADDGCPRCAEPACELCRECHSRPIPPPKRKYCAACSPLASTIWKRRMREIWRQEGGVVEIPNRDRVRYRVYMRDYMRRRRAEARETRSVGGAPGKSEGGCK